VLPLDSRILLLATLAVVSPPTASGPHPTATFQTPGTKTVTLKVCSPTGSCSTVTKTLTVLDPAPKILSVTVPATLGMLGAPATLAASGSGKPPLSYRWTLQHPDGSTTTGPESVLSFAPPGPGTYPVTLTLSNAYGSANLQKTLSVVPNVFADVQPDFWAADAIETLYFAAITTGCDRSPAGSLLFCPDAHVTRAEIAVLLGRALHPLPFQPPAPIGIFQDVPPTFWAAAWIEQLFRDRVTTGCAPNRFCPAATLSRAEMAILLERALHPPLFTPAPPIGLFADVPTSFWAASWIEQLSREGLTNGCNASGLLRFFCPSQTLTRAELAVFLGRAFHLAQHPTPLRFQAVLCAPPSCSYPAGMPVNFDLQLSGGIPTAYDYDWNGDGTFEETTVFPVAHVYSQAGSYQPRLRLRHGTSASTITHPYPIVVARPSSNPSPPSTTQVAAEALVSPAATDPPGTLARRAYQISAPSQAGISGYAVFVNANGSYAFAGLLQANRAIATDRLLLPVVSPSGSRFLYLRAFSASGYGSPSIPVRVP